MQAKQSQQDFDLSLQQAIADPTTANLQHLLMGLEQLLAELPHEVQLKIAGFHRAQLIDIYTSRAERLLEEWEEKYNPVQSEPILTADLLHDVLRQTMTLNLDAVLETPLQWQPTLQPSDSIAGTVDKTNLLEFLTQMDQESSKHRALSVAHDENVSGWIKTLVHWMNQHPTQEVSLLTLQHALQMPLIKLWLALLLGGFKLEQRGEFYQLEGIWVSQGNSVTINSEVLQSLDSAVAQQ